VNVCRNEKKTQKMQTDLSSNGPAEYIYNWSMVFLGSRVLKKRIVSTFNHNPYSAKNTNNNMLLKRKKMVFRWRTNCKL